MPLALFESYDAGKNLCLEWSKKQAKKNKETKIHLDLIPPQIRGFLFQFCRDAFKTSLLLTDNKTEAMTDTLSGYVTLTFGAYTSSLNFYENLKDQSV